MSAHGDDQDRSTGKVDLDRLADVIASGDEVSKVIRLHAAEADGGLLVAVRVALDADKALSSVAGDIEAIKERIRAAVPNVRLIWVEPDIYRPAIDPQPPTDVFVLRSAD